jgi:molybdopterin synthase catalytic subunit
MVVHRVGRIRPGEAIVLVAALSIHRASAFEAVRVLMDYLKTDAPLWKKETAPGGARWIEPRAEDHTRRRQAEKDMA